MSICFFPLYFLLCYVSIVLYLGFVLRSFFSLHFCVVLLSKLILGFVLGLVFAGYVPGRVKIYSHASLLIDQ